MRVSITWGGSYGLPKEAAANTEGGAVGSRWIHIYGVDAALGTME